MYSIIPIHIFILSSNNSITSILLLKNIAFKIIRTYFDSKGFIEINNKILINSNIVESNIIPIKIKSSSRSFPFKYLQTSPELLLKKKLSLGLQHIYQISSVFRQDILDTTHTSEFTLIEWYRTKSSLNKIIYDCNKIIFNLYYYINSYYFFNFKKYQYLLNITSLSDLFLFFFNINLTLILTIHSKVFTKNYCISSLFINKFKYSIDNSIDFILLEYISSKIKDIGFLILNKWPIPMASLSNSLNGDYLYSERIEVYFNNLELGNGYNELIFPYEQYSRLYLEQKKQIILSKIDFTFIQNLKNCILVSGIAIGVERLFMFLLNKRNITQVSSFF